MSNSKITPQHRRLDSPYQSFCQPSHPYTPGLLLFSSCPHILPAGASARVVLPGPSNTPKSEPPPPLVVKPGLTHHCTLLQSEQTSRGSPVFLPASTSMRVVLPAPVTPMRQVSTLGRKAPLMPSSSSSQGVLPSMCTWARSWAPSCSHTTVTLSVRQQSDARAPGSACSSINTGSACSSINTDKLSGSC